MSASQDFFINATGSGDTTLIAAPPAHQFIRVLHYHVTTDRPTTLLFKSDSTTKDGTYATNSSGGGISTPEYETGIFDCDSGEPLIINLSVAANVLGAGKYTIKGGPPPTN